MQKLCTTSMFAALLSGLIVFGSGNPLYAAQSAEKLEAAPSGVSPVDAAPVPAPRVSTAGPPFQLLPPGFRPPMNGASPQSKWSNSLPANSARPGQVSRTIHFLGQFCGHSPTENHALPGQRQEMHGRSLHLRVRF